MNKNMRANSGVTLVSVLVAVAIMAVIGLTVAVIYENMTSLMTKAVITSDADNLAKLVQGVMSQKDLCGRTLLGVPYNAGALPPATTGIVLNSVDIWDPPRANRVAVATPGMRVGGENSPIVLQSITLRPPIDPATGGPGGAWPPSGGTYIPPNPAVPHASYTGTIVMTFNWADARRMVGGQLRPRFANVTFGVNTTTNTISDCPGASIQMKSFDCRTQTASRCDADAAAMSAATGQTCEAYYYVSGFDANGSPVCACDVTCNLTGSRAAGAAGAVGAVGPGGGGGAAARGASSGGAN